MRNLPIKYLLDPKEILLMPPKFEGSPTEPTESAGFSDRLFSSSRASGHSSCSDRSSPGLLEHSKVPWSLED